MLLVDNSQSNAWWDGKVARAGGWPAKCPITLLRVSCTVKYSNTCPATTKDQCRDSSILDFQKHFMREHERLAMRSLYYSTCYRLLGYLRLRQTNVVLRSQAQGGSSQGNEQGASNRGGGRCSFKSPKIRQFNYENY